MKPIVSTFLASMLVTAPFFTVMGLAGGVVDGCARQEVDALRSPVGSSVDDLLRACPEDNLWVDRMDPEIYTRAHTYFLGPGAEEAKASFTGRLHYSEGAGFAGLLGNRMSYHATYSFENGRLVSSEVTYTED